VNYGKDSEVFIIVTLDLKHMKGFLEDLCPRN
jgi:hypothetical protein